MIRALSLDLRSADAARYSEVRRQYHDRRRSGHQRTAYELREPEEVFRCTLCGNLGEIQPCMACRLKHDIPLPDEMQEGGGR